MAQQGQTGGRAVAVKRADLSYDALDRVDGIRRYAGAQLAATTDLTFDAAGRLTGIAHAKGGTSLGTYAYTYDAANRLTAATVPTASGTNTTAYAFRPGGSMLTRSRINTVNPSFFASTIVFPQSR